MMNENAINTDIVVLYKQEYEILTNDSMLANLTRKFLKGMEDNYANISALRFIYDIPMKKEVL